jgi:hypothetical protein
VVVIGDIALEGLSGRSLLERQRLLAQEYFGFDPAVARAQGFDLPLWGLRPGERPYFLASAVPLVEWRPEGVWLLSRLFHPDGEMMPAGVADVTVTDQRVVAVGVQRSMSWEFDALLGVTWQPPHHQKLLGRRQRLYDACLLHVTDREDAAGFGVQPRQRPTVDFVLQLAFTDHTGERDELVRSLDPDIQP